jgi:hypothetical protein
MSRRYGQCVISWLERGGEKFLRTAPTYVYQQFLLHVGATDVLRHYDYPAAYWPYVQAILDTFFTSAQRAELCSELINSPVFAGREDFRPFLIEAQAEIRLQEVIAGVNIVAGIEAPLRSVG